jgi:hypothetical protein
MLDNHEGHEGLDELATTNTKKRNLHIVDGGGSRALRAGRIERGSGSQALLPSDRRLRIAVALDPCAGRRPARSAGARDVQPCLVFFETFVCFVVD